MLVAKQFFVAAYFLTSQLFTMKVYIVTENPCVMVGSEDLKIMKVPPEQEAAFLEEYAGRILAVGSSIQDALIKFSLALNNE